ncbi:hypothetical protein [Saccharopolyspora sp. 6V]|uniref:hypothetical protein n=1 Tax=Saccharopolyspora sp. 6V TaxID=2877239 RepID=UPI001CD454F7|nr:hypothetical protein [Saccharopolyspora sp. 6V]MCA1193162.1 hypothetical protein [Saccharopolyspora sp. 6V]
MPKTHEAVLIHRMAAARTSAAAPPAAHSSSEQGQAITGWPTTALRTQRLRSITMRRA